MKANEMKTPEDVKAYNKICNQLAEEQGYADFQTMGVMHGGLNASVWFEIARRYAAQESRKAAIEAIKVAKEILKLTRSLEFPVTAGNLSIKNIETMNKTIYKYPLRVDDVQNIDLPVGAKILTVQVQNEVPCLWALVDPNEADKRSITIEIFGTGHPVGYDMGVSRKYISTFQLRGGQLVFHVFEYSGV